ncbi:MAG: hypothetical protein H7645_11565, partial [Candidatus Heimdallarchaeota archaeon]|nr:hypothetical protein [Candidatus Heimdallarchaeota archaeon]MCK4770961.1 hypothetical protein [Candidatus Heimdallarchaeota archaeon]
NAKDGTKVSGATHIQGNLDTEGYVDIKGSLKTGGNVTGVDIYFDRYKWYYFGYWMWLILYFWKWFRIPYVIGGNILAKNYLEVNRTHIKGDVRAKRVRIRRFCQIDGDIYYTEECRIHKKAKFVGKLLQINEEEL